MKMKGTVMGWFSKRHRPAAAPAESVSPMAAAILSQESVAAARKVAAQKQVHELWVPAYRLIDVVAPEGAQALKSLGRAPSASPLSGRLGWGLVLFKVEFRPRRGMLTIFIFEDGGWERLDPEPPDLLQSVDKPPLIIDDVHEARAMLQNAIIEFRKGWGRKGYFMRWDLD